MKRFIFVNESEAAAKGYPEAEANPWGNDRMCLYETDGEKPIRLVAMDGGEPEDQSFGRDWSWVLRELNKLADDIESMRNPLGQNKNQG